MDNRFQNNSGEETEHPSREMLLLCVDGELPAKEAAQMETHLEACWPCRVKTKKIQEAIADIIEFDEVVTPRIVPPQNWRNFDRQLRQLARESGSRSLSSRLFGSLARFFPAIRSVAVPRHFPKVMLMPIARTAAVALILALIVVLVIRFNREPIVSASELLRNVTEAQAAKIRATEAPVVHQRFQVRRKDQASSREESLNWEIWNDTVNSRFREFISEDTGTQGYGDTGKERHGDTETRRRGDTSGSSLSPNSRVPASPRRAPDLLTELNAVLVANHMDPQRPLSAASYQSWRNTLQHQQDEVTRSKLADGADALTLRTIPAAPVNVGQIAEALFVVRARDWQPTELRLSVVAEGRNRVYELTGSVSEVVSLAQVNPSIFAELVATPSSTKQPETPNSKLETRNSKPETIAPQPLSTASLATVELEVEALRLLNQAGADLGEQITVKRTVDEMLHVTGIVETEQRKNEITNALNPIASNPAVWIEIQTVAEAVARQTPTKTRPPSVRQIEITGNTIAAEPELRSYFAGKGKDTDEAIRQYAAQMVSLSGRGMDHLWAMKRLLNQFSADQLSALTPEVRSKWVSLIRAHARSYQKTTESLRRELQPVFFPAQSSDAVSTEGTITDTNELSRVIERLFELGSSNDRVIRSAFTSSADGVMTTVIKAPQFWQSLKNAEALATQIANSQ